MFLYLYNVHVNYSVTIQYVCIDLVYSMIEAVAYLPHLHEDITRLFGPFPQLNILSLLEKTSVTSNFWSAGSNNFRDGFYIY